MTSCRDDGDSTFEITYDLVVTQNKITFGLNNTQYSSP